MIYPIGLFLSVCLVACSQVPLAVMPAATLTGSPNRTTPSPVPTQNIPTLTPSLTPLPWIDRPVRWCFKGTQPGDLELVNERLNELLQDRSFNLSVEILIFEPLGYFQRVQDLQRSSQPCDIFFVPASFYSSLVEQGGLLPISCANEANRLEMFAPRLWAGLPADLWKALCHQGQIFVIPNQYAYAQAPGFSIRADVVRALDLQPRLNQVATWEDLAPIFSIVQAGIEDGSLAENGISNPGEVRQVLGQVDLFAPENFGFEIIYHPVAVRMEDPGPVNWLSSSDFARMAQLRRDWQNAGYLPGVGLAPDEIQAGYHEGRFVAEAGHIVWSGDLPTQSRRYGYTWIDYPLGPGLITGASLRSSLTGLDPGLANDSRRFERVLMLLDEVQADPDFYHLLAIGIEGTHWRWSGPEHTEIVLIQGSQYQPDFVSQLGNRSLAYPGWVEGMPAGEDVSILNANAARSPALGFIFDPRPVAGEAAAVQGVLRELLNPLDQGRVENIDKEIERIMKSLQEAGFDLVMEEIRTQYDTWQSSQP